MSLQYIPFSSFVFRTPCFPLSKDVELVLAKSETGTIFNEALFLASPELCAERQKYEQLTDKEKRKVDISVEKYASRMRSRCTPFGLFAGCSVGEWGDKNEVQFAKIDLYRRCTRLDMNYVCALIQHFETLSNIRPQLHYFPNNSIYELGGRVRYIEYYFRKTRRIHQISSVEKSEYLMRILSEAYDGKTPDALAASIVEDEITHEDAIEFVMDMIDNQLLKSELEASVTGKNPIDRLIERLSALQGTNEYVSILKEIKNQLEQIDCQPIGSTLEVYSSIIESVKKVGVDFEPKYLFQTDLFKSTTKAKLSIDITKELHKIITFLNKISPKIQTESNLSRFKEAFQKRYEEAEVPLLQALDNDLGIGYPAQEGYTGDINRLVDDLLLPIRNSSPPKYYKLPNDDILFRKYTESIRLGNTEIALDDADFPAFQAVWNDLPSTINVMCSIVSENPLVLYVKSVGGTSAGNLFGRFCHVDSEIYRLTRSIMDKEQELDPDVIMAEIVHLPEARIGNILSRPVLRKYEIPYLARPSVEFDNQIPLSDIMICIRDGRVVLKSIRHGKEIKPRLTTAHNFSFNSQPAYHLMCDLQAQNIRGGLNLQLGAWAETLDYIPRITYKGHLIGRAKWRVKQEEIKDFEKLPDDILLKKIDTWRVERGLSERFLIPDGDNELLVDSRNPLSVATMLAQVKKRLVFMVEEFLFDDVSKVTPLGFTNEYIFPFYRSTGN